MREVPSPEAIIMSDPSTYSGSARAQSRAEWSRRDFLSIGGAAAAAALNVDQLDAAAQRPTGLLAAPPIATVRIGMVGVGLQGGSHLRNFLRIPGCRISAVCDIREERTSWARQQVAAAGQ